MSDLERRFTPVPVELRARQDELRIGGYASVFNRESKNLGGFIEKVAPGFFNDSRSRGWPDVQARYNHEDEWLMGTTRAGTLSLDIDSTGLLYDVLVNRDDPSAMTVHARVARGDVTASSFAFRTFEDEWSTTDQGFPLRTLMTGQLVDVAPVNVPAYPDATAGLRSLAKHFEADLDEVKALAKQDELRKFFQRTDGPQAPPKKLSLVDARAMLAKRL